MLHKVLILDANQRSALAATRSLGKKGISVVVADETRGTLSGSSRYCKETLVYPSPYEYSLDFIATLKKECVERDINIMFPMTEITTYLILKHRSEFNGIHIPFVDFEAFDALTDKWKLFKLAQQLNIPIPKTYFIENLALTSTLTSVSLKFPVVLKPYRSRILSNGEWIGTSVKYANSVTELEDIIEKTEYLKQHPFLIQEYVKGEGQGIFALYNHGEPVVFFAHRRLREKPPSGGVSVLSESVEIDQHMRKIAQKILDYVKWHGVAMVEFKVTSDGTPYLMEVNARFWGSLQLTVDAGVDFPWLLYQIATGEALDSINGYKVGVKNRWLLGDIDNLYLQLFKKQRVQSLSYLEKWQIIKNFLKFFENGISYEINRWDDLRPFFFELKEYFRK
ncbi:MAG: ATP-grasp domain-containing protein [Nitrospirae bacterium]|nr:ATP-grasp domain-containing protein [Nitrospirota bacterium]